MSNADRRPIVIRRKKAASHATHGAWKIAYADFMTAMMAFFLVMWLLSGLNEAQLESVSEYFRTPLKVALVGGDRNSASDSAIPGGGDNPIHSDGEDALTRPDARNYQRDQGRLRHLKHILEAMIDADPALREMRSQLMLEVVEDGLLIQITDNDKRPMFQLGSARLAPYISDVLRKIAPKVNELPNRITLTGHTDDLRYASGERFYSNWELSTDRANAARRALVDGGMSPDKLLQVIGAAATVSRPGASADAPANRRIGILVLNAEAQARIESNGRARTGHRRGTANAGTPQIVADPHIERLQPTPHPRSPG